MAARERDLERGRNQVTSTRPTVMLMKIISIVNNVENQFETRLVGARSSHAVAEVSLRWRIENVKTFHAIILFKIK